MTERMDLAGKHIVLGLSGGIACYKAAELTRALVKVGATVQVVMTEGAEAFITPVTRVVGNVPGRNDPCHCGSGKKFKKCHGAA